MNAATPIDVWNQVVLPGLMPQILAAGPERRQKVYEGSLQGAEDMLAGRGIGRRPRDHPLPGGRTRRACTAPLSGYLSQGRLLVQPHLPLGRSTGH